MSRDLDALYVKTADYDDNDDPAVITVSTGAWRHQIAVEQAEASTTIVTGTLALSGVPYGCADAQPITDEAGDPIVFDLAAPPCIALVTGIFTAFELAPTSVVGIYTVSAVGTK